MKINRVEYFFSRGNVALLKFCIAVICVFCIAPVSLYGQDMANLNIEKVQDEGLTNNYIPCISQDKNGFMWFGTREGLFRYDGYAFKAFRNFSGGSGIFVNNPVTCLYAEKNNLWVGSTVGLSSIDINTQTIKNYPAPVPVQIRVIFPANDSTFWVGTYTGLYQFNKKTLQWKKMPFAGADAIVTSICDDKKGRLYFMGTTGFCRYTKSTGAYSCYYPHLPYYPKIPNVQCPAFCRAILGNDGNIWIGTWGGGLVQFNTQTEKFKVWLNQTDDVHILPYKIILDLMADGNGNIWLANKEGGLTIFDPAKNKFTNYPVDWRSDGKLSGAVMSLFRDRAGIYWIGTSNGIFKYDPYNVHLSRTDIWLKTANGIVPSQISPLTMFKDDDGFWWMGMYEGLFRFDPQKNILYDYSKKLGIPDNWGVFGIIRDADGAIWFTAGNRLFKILKKTSHKHKQTAYRTEIYRSAAITGSITTLYIDKENRIWIGTHYNGIFRFDTATNKIVSCNYIEKGPHNAINETGAFCEISKDSLLVGGVNTGLLLLNPANGRFKKIQLYNMPVDISINDIYKKGGAIWIATQYNGLLQTDANFKKPSILTINDGLPSMEIKAISADRENNLWLLTNSGVVKYQLGDRKIRLFDEKDGLQNLGQLNCMMTDSNITIGGRGYLYTFNPARVIKNTLPPKVFITGLKVFDKDYDVQKSKAIHLKYNQNYFSLAYVALNYTQSKLNRYAYKMEGLDKQWNDAGSLRNVSYANLEEGTYTFNVKACNNEGIWNNVPAKLIIIISPPFWHRSWFYLLVFAMVAGIIYALYMYNINQLKIRLQMRDKIARDLHDDIGSTLSGINIFSKIALQKMHADQSGGLELVEKISDRSQKTLDALSDIVWSINTRNDGMDNFLMKANEYLSVLEVQGIAYDFSVEPDMEHLKIGMILRKELYLIFKEAICNAYKYSGCSFIQIYLTRHKDTCTLSIHDNGKGFDADTVTSGNGIYNMRQRAKKMNAEFHVESQVNKGTTITLNFSITQFR